LLSANANNNQSQEKINLIGIVGGGIMGRGIAQTISSAGFEIILVEKNEETMARSQQALSDAMDREIQKWAMTKSEKKSILSRIAYTTNIEQLKDCDIVIEAVDEILELKLSIFQKLDSILKPSAIIVSNTSSLSLSDLASNTNRPDKIIGMHFLNPVPKIPLVELVRAIETSEQTLRIAKKFAEKIGKTAVEVYEFPGFITTRCIIPLLNEAAHVLMEALATAKDIDAAMKLGYNLPMGPLEMADTMGLDEVLSWMDSLWKSLGEARYRPCPILRKLVREKKLGKKTGEGFHKYNAEGKIIN
jgi:3-hydroxybutyryl-CoA dehydrogenase